MPETVLMEIGNCGFKITNLPSWSLLCYIYSSHPKATWLACFAPAFAHRGCQFYNLICSRFDLNLEIHINIFIVCMSNLVQDC